MSTTSAARLGALIPARFRDQFFLRAFGLLKVPLIGYVRPKVVESTDERCVICIPLNRRTRNHLGSMYFGTLAVGADTAGGLLAMRLIELRGGGVNLVFKDFKAEFLRRPEDDVLFRCDDGQAIAALVDKAFASDERQDMPVRIVASERHKPDVPVATFTLTLSLKRRGAAKAQR